MSWCTRRAVSCAEERETAHPPLSGSATEWGGVFMEYRRRAERQPTAWAGFCHIAGESPTMWRDCEVIDISMFGLGITLQHPQPWELVDRRILVDITSIGDAMSV